MKYYAVIDTNVLVSSLLKWTSVPGSVSRHILAGNLKHFPVQKFVVTPREMLDIIECN